MIFNPYLIIKTILITEKSLKRQDINKYTFKVDKYASKIDIIRAIELIYDSVRVKSVNIFNRIGKLKRVSSRSAKYGYTSSKKYAIVTLLDGKIVTNI